MDRKDAIKSIVFDTLLLGAIAGCVYEVNRESKLTGPGTTPYECTEAGLSGDGYARL
jgi:hypothetical protein